MITQDELKTILFYEPISGLFTWIEYPSKKRKNQVAGYFKPHGGVVIRINKKVYYAHRLAFLYMTGKFPEHQVDHKDGNSANNAWENLREATNAQNLQNQRKPKAHNKTGFLGVSKSLEKFRATIRLNGKNKSLGSYSTAKEAHEAYLNAKRELHEFCTI